MSDKPALTSGPGDLLPSSGRPGHIYIKGNTQHCLTWGINSKLAKYVNQLKIWPQGSDKSTNVYESRTQHIFQISRDTWIIEGKIQL